MKSIADKAIHRPYIDGLRGVAILSVMAVHVPIGPAPYTYGAIQSLVEAGARGVQLFFLLSAFTLFRSSKSKYIQEKSPRRNFYIRRAFRILPLWWITILVYALARHQSFRDSLPNVLMYFGFIRFKSGVETFPLGWSIFVEETFYVLLPLIFVYIHTLRRAALFFAGLTVLSVAWIKGASHIGVPTSNSYIALFPVAQWPCLAMGILVFFVSEHEKFQKAVLESPLALRIAEGGTILLLALLYRSNFLAMTVPLAMMFLVSMSDRSMFGRLARTDILQRFGISCYSIYLFHLLLSESLEPVRRWLFDALHLSGAPGEIQFLIWFPIFAAVNLLLGVVSFRLVEKPCVNLGKRVIQRLGA